MTVLGEQVADYLAVRRALGYKLARAEKLLAQFVVWMDERGRTRVTREAAIEWATLPPATGSNWHAQRLAVIRAFAGHLHAIDPAHDVLPADLLVARKRRAVPFLYSDEDVLALMDAAAAVTPDTHRVATFRTLVGLLGATGMRVGEAIGLDQGDLDGAANLLTVRAGKFGKSRQLALHPTTTTALRAYLRRTDRPTPAEPTEALLVSAAGTRLRYCNVHLAFKRMIAHAGIGPRAAGCRPRIHDLRHTFAVRSLIDAHQADEVDIRLPVLSTYLGHIHPGSTYWYLQAAPELLELAARRLDDHLENGGR